MQEREIGDLKMGRFARIYHYAVVALAAAFIYHHNKYKVIHKNIEPLYSILPNKN